MRRCYGDSYDAAWVYDAGEVAERLRRGTLWSTVGIADGGELVAHVRLARVLLEIATSCGEAVDDGVRISVELSQTELAYLIGAREDTVQRALRQLRGPHLRT